MTPTIAEPSRAAAEGRSATSPVAAPRRARPERQRRSAAAPAWNGRRGSGRMQRRRRGCRDGGRATSPTTSSRPASIPRKYTTKRTTRLQRDRTSAPPAAAEKQANGHHEQGIRRWSSAHAVPRTMSGAQRPRRSQGRPPRQACDWRRATLPQGARSPVPVMQVRYVPQGGPPCSAAEGPSSVPATHGDQWHGRGFDLTSVSAARHMRTVPLDTL